jgi:prepilin peptidase CpaA
MCGLFLHFFSGDPLFAILTGILVLAAATIPWHFGLLGGADVKLLAAAAIVVPTSSLGNLLLAIALAGGVLATLYLILSYLTPRPAPGRRTGLLRRVLKAEAWRIHRRGPLPYAAAIAAGTILTLFPG